MRMTLIKSFAYDSELDREFAINGNPKQLRQPTLARQAHASRPMQANYRAMTRLSNELRMSDRAKIYPSHH